MAKQFFSFAKASFLVLSTRLRWTGQTPPDNTADLVAAIETNISQEEPEVQWAMNFTAGWIGVYDEENRARCMEIGEKTGLYKATTFQKDVRQTTCRSLLRLK